MCAGILKMSPVDSHVSQGWKPLLQSKKEKPWVSVGDKGIESHRVGVKAEVVRLGSDWVDSDQEMDLTG